MCFCTCLKSDLLLQFISKIEFRVVRRISCFLAGGCHYLHWDSAKDGTPVYKYSTTFSAPCHQCYNTVIPLSIPHRYPILCSQSHNPQENIQQGLLLVRCLCNSRLVKLTKLDFSDRKRSGISILT